jgi:predicted nucleic acid-binding protein
MSAKPFIDTNILIYAFASNDPRSEKAEAILGAGGIVSVQVLNEFVNVSRRKQRRDWDEIREILCVLKALIDPPLPVTMEIHEAAIEIARDRGFHFYDSLIVSAAMQAGCSILYSEDLQHGQLIGHLTVHNPFRE